MAALSLFRIHYSLYTKIALLMAVLGLLYFVLVFTLSIRLSYIRTSLANELPHRTNTVFYTNSQFSAHFTATPNALDYDLKCN